MKKALLTFLMALSFFSCIKKEQKIKEEAQVIQLLNKSEADSALTKIDTLLAKDPANEDLLYLKASALSMQAGVDVYKLFPLLKVKIFDVAITQWSEQREFEKKMQEQRKIGDVYNQEKTSAVYIPLEDDKIDYKLQDLYGYKTEGYCQLSVEIETPHLKTDWRNISYLTLPLMPLDPLCILMDDEDWRQLILKDPTFYEKIILAIKQNHQDQWNERSEKVAKNKDKARGLEVLWKITEMIPIIRQIPQISSRKLSKLQEAQDILLNISTKNKAAKNEIYHKSRKQLMMISALKIISRFQEAFDLEKINSPTDLICTSNESTSALLADSQGDARLIIEGIDDDNFKDKNSEALMKVQDILKKEQEKSKNDPDYRDKLIAKIQKSVDRIKEENCLGEIH